MKRLILIAIFTLVVIGIKVTGQDYSQVDTRVNQHRTPKTLAFGLAAPVKLDAEAVKIVSWNIQDLGRTKSASVISEIVGVLKDFDIVAIQEVVAQDPAGAQAVAKIAGELNRSGSKWNYSISPPTHNKSPQKRERYAFLWKSSKVKLKTKATLDDELKYVVNREPFIGEFVRKNDSASFYVINYHARVHNEEPEKEIAHFYNYPNHLQSNKIIIAGDFNLDEQHQVWERLYRFGIRPALRNKATTLKRACKNGNYLNHAIDNIYYNSKEFSLVSSGRIDIVGYCDNLIHARTISDHLPVYAEFEL